MARLKNRGSIALVYGYFTLYETRPPQKTTGDEKAKGRKKGLWDAMKVPNFAVLN